MATQGTRALTEVITAAQGALAWHGTARLRPLCQAPASEHPHMLRSGLGVLWQGGLPFPTLPGKVD